ncbi:MAG: dienelactone hydrolase family protein [Rhodospirillales bacterium]
MAAYEEIIVDDNPSRLCVGVPPGKGPHPAMIVMCHGAGLDKFTEDRVDRLAEAGYVTAAPDVFHRIAHITDSAEKRANMTDTEIGNDIVATIDYLQARDDVDGSRIGIVGHCMGGRMSFQGAIVSDAIKACVVYYGGNMMKAWGENESQTPFEQLDRITCPVIGFFGLDDTNPSPSDVDQIESSLKTNKIDYEFHRYENAGHAFQNFLNEKSYREGPTQESWARTLAFLKKHLG